MDRKIMRLAIDEAFKAIRKHEGGPFGAVILKDGKIISVGHSSVFKTKDPTEHAVVNAIRKASKKLKSPDLSGCEVVTNGEPCPMCFGSIYWAKIKKVYFGTNINDSIGAGINELRISAKTINKEGKGNVKIFSGIMRKDCLAPFKEFKEENVHY
jgi:guanine deaminase